jgi:methionyl-tRNA formyltransferase
MRIIFMGTPDFAVPTLDALVAGGHEILAVVAQPDKPAGRGNHMQSPPTIERARALGLPTRQPKALRSGPFPAWFTSADADVAVVVAYGRILPLALLQAPRRGCLNVHASLLPKLRGAAPIQWSVIRGEAQTGVTIMQMDEGLDTGDMLATAATPIGPDETSAELWARLSQSGARLLVETLDRLDTIAPIAQDHAAATLAPPLTKETGRIDWSQPAQRIHDLVRGTIPWPGATTALRGQPLKIHQTRISAGQGEPGQVLVAGKQVIVATGDGAIELLRVQLPGKGVQPAAAALVNGARLTVGERLGEG